MPPRTAGRAPPRLSDGAQPPLGRRLHASLPPHGLHPRRGDGARSWARAGRRRLRRRLAPAQPFPRHLRRGRVQRRLRAHLFARAGDARARRRRALLGADCSRCCWRSQIVLLALALLFMPQLVLLLAPGLRRRSRKVRAGGDADAHHLPLSAVRHAGDAARRATLNAHERFAAAAAAPVLLNVAIVAASRVAFLFPERRRMPRPRACSLAGVLELAADGRRGKARRRARRGSRGRGWTADVTQFFKTLGPAVIGSAGVQIAHVRRHDHRLDAADRRGVVALLRRPLYQLPIGVIGIAAGTVLLPEMSRRFAAGDDARRASRRRTARWR